MASTVAFMTVMILGMIGGLQANDGLFIDVTRVKVKAPVPSIQTLWERSVVECVARCLNHVSCFAMEFLETCGKCRLFRSLTISSVSYTSSDAPYSQAVVRNVKTHTNPVKHVTIPTSTFPNTTAQITLFSTTFRKISSSSGLRVTYSGSYGSYGCTECCSQFSFTFNGSLCSNSVKLDYSAYNSILIDHNLPAVKDGICDGLKAGPVTVGIKNTFCTYKGPKRVSQSNIAFDCNSHLMIEEVFYPHNASPSASRVGIFQSTSDVSTPTCSTSLTSLHYTKQANDTDLIVLFSGSIRIWASGRCGRWYFVFNGQECSSPGKVGEMIVLQSTNQNFLRNTVIGGICSNLGPGTIKIDFGVERCPTSLGFRHESCFSGYSSTENIIVEEVRLNIPFPMLDNPAFNIDYKHWTGTYNNDSGIITTLNYNKVSDNTALRFRFFGSLSSYVATGSGGSKWCFEVDGLVCNNPGPACTTYWTGNNMNVPRPFELLSVCRGVRAGARAVNFVVKPLTSGGGDAVTGWSTYAENYLLVDEVFMV